MAMGLVLASQAACNDDERHFVRTEETVLEANGERPMGGGCNAISSGSKVSTSLGAAGSGGATISLTLESIGDGVRVVLTNGTETIERSFDASWLRGDKPAETLELPIDAERRYRVRLSGALQCGPPNEVDGG